MDRFCLIHPCDRRTELRWLRRAESIAAFARENYDTVSEIDLWTLDNPGAPFSVGARKRSASRLNPRLYATENRGLQSHTPIRQRPKCLPETVGLYFLTISYKNSQNCFCHGAFVKFQITLMDFDATVG